MFSAKIENKLEERMGREDSGRALSGGRWRFDNVSYGKAPCSHISVT